MTLDGDAVSDGLQFESPALIMGSVAEARQVRWRHAGGWAAPGGGILPLELLLLCSSGTAKVRGLGMGTPQKDFPVAWLCWTCSQ